MVTDSGEERPKPTADAGSAAESPTPAEGKTTDAEADIGSVQTTGSAGEPAPSDPAQSVPASPADGNPANGYGGYPEGAENYYGYGPGETSGEATPPAAEADSQSLTAPAVPPSKPPADKVSEDEAEEEEGGGPVKSFLEHLEDLRWMLIKVVLSVFFAMLFCLIGGKYLVAFLTWPLKHAQSLGFSAAPNTNVIIQLGTNIVGRVPTSHLGMWTGQTNRIAALEIAPIPWGSNIILGLKVTTNAAPDNPPDMVVLKNYGPISAFMVALKLALFGGLVISAPLVIYFIGQFVLPALKVKEKKWLYKIAGFGSGLFFLGVAFCYFIIMQVALLASVQFSQWMGFGADEWRAEEYISFVCKFMLGMGLSFQLPLVILTFVKIGLLDYRKLSGFRAYWVVINLVISAVVTPSGDPVTMVLFALPLQILYEIATGIAWYWDRQDRKREAAEAAANTK